MNPPPGDEPVPEPDPPRLDGDALRRGFLRASLAFYGGGYLAVVGLALAFESIRLEYLPGPIAEAATWTTALRWIGIGTGCGLAIVGAGYVSSRLFPRLASLEREFATYLFWIRGWRDALVLALLSGFAEEVFFRGLLQPWLGLVGASVVFAVCHPPLSRKLLAWPLFAFGIGLLMGWLFDASGGNLLAPTAVHFVVNFLNLQLIARRIPEIDPAGTPFAPLHSLIEGQHGVEDPSGSSNQLMENDLGK